MIRYVSYRMLLTHWGRVMYTYVSKLTIIGSDNSLSPGRRQAIICTSAGILLIRTCKTTFSEIASEIHAFSFTKMHLKMSSAKWLQFCLGLNELKVYNPIIDPHNIKVKPFPNSHTFWTNTSPELSFCCSSNIFFRKVWIAANNVASARKHLSH